MPHNGVVVVLPIRHEVHGLAGPRGGLHTLQPSPVSKVPDQGKMGCIVGCDCMARRNTVDTFNAHAPCCCTQVPSLTFECKCSCSSWRCCTGRCTCTRQARPQRVHRTHPEHPLGHGSTRTRNRRRTMTSQKANMVTVGMPVEGEDPYLPQDAGICGWARGSAGGGGGGRRNKGQVSTARDKMEGPSAQCRCAGEWEG